MIRITAELKSSFRREINSMICAWMVTSSAVVGSSAIRMSGLHDERHRDHRALAHAARELVRDSRRRASPDSGYPPGAAAPPPASLARALVRRVVRPDRLDDLVADPVDRVQRRHRILEDHPDLGAAVVLQLALRDVEHVLALVDDLALEDRVHVRGSSPSASSRSRSCRSPDSPTIPSTSPRASSNETPSTARTTPSSVAKWTLRSSTSSSALSHYVGLIRGSRYA